MLSPEKSVLMAEQIARNAHDGQFDKQGVPYIFHVVSVAQMARLHGYTCEVAAFLHDTIEDTHITLDDLRIYGFDPEVLSIVSLLTRNKSESYTSFILKIKANHRASLVKMCDLRDNLDIRRSFIDFQNPAKDEFRILKYTYSYHFLSGKIEEVVYVRMMERLTNSLNKELSHE